MLPPDTLLEIFSRIIDSSSPSEVEGSLQSLCLVCSAWRNTVESFPRLWRRRYLETTVHSSRNIRDFHDRFAAKSFAAFNHLGSQSQLELSLRLHFDLPPKDHFVGTSRRTHRRHRHLDDRPNQDVRSETQPYLAPKTLHRLPLVIVYAQDNAILHWMATLPTQWSESITHLTLRTSTPYPFAVVYTLGRFPELEALEYSLIDLPRPLASNQVIEQGFGDCGLREGECRTPLSKLRKLSLCYTAHTTQAMHGIFNHLSVPALEVLSIRIAWTPELQWDWDEGNLTRATWWGAYDARIVTWRLEAFLETILPVPSPTIDRGPWRASDAACGLRSLTLENIFTYDEDYIDVYRARLQARVHPYNRLFTHFPHLERLHILHGDATVVAAGQLLQDFRLGPPQLASRDGFQPPLLPRLRSIQFNIGEGFIDEALVQSMDAFAGWRATAWHPTSKWVELEEWNVAPYDREPSASAATYDWNIRAS